MQVNYSLPRNAEKSVNRIKMKEQLVRELAGSNSMAAEELRLLLKIRREASARL